VAVSLSVGLRRKSADCVATPTLRKIGGRRSAATHENRCSKGLPFQTKPRLRWRKFSEQSKRRCL